MVTIKSAREIDLMRKSGAVAAEALRLGGEAVKPGATTKEIDRIMHDYVKKKTLYLRFLTTADSRLRRVFR